MQPIRLFNWISIIALTFGCISIGLLVLTHFTQHDFEWSTLHQIWLVGSIVLVLVGMACSIYIARRDWASYKFPTVSPMQRRVATIFCRLGLLLIILSIYLKLWLLFAFSIVLFLSGIVIALLHRTTANVQHKQYQPSNTSYQSFI